MKFKILLNIIPKQIILISWYVLDRHLHFKPERTYG